MAVDSGLLGDMTNWEGEIPVWTKALKDCMILGDTIITEHTVTRSRHKGGQHTEHMKTVTKFY